MAAGEAGCCEVGVRGPAAVKALERREQLDLPVNGIVVPSTLLSSPASGSLRVTSSAVASGESREAIGKDITYYVIFCVLVGSARRLLDNDDYFTVIDQRPAFGAHHALISSLSRGC